MVDELDRCRPSYAIALLERVKHLFEADGVAFIFSTDTGQLQHAVRGVYGGEFDGRNYLSRFFDRRYVFARPQLSDFIMMRLEGIDWDKLGAGHQRPTEAIIDGIQSLKGVQPRDIEKILDIFHATVSAWKIKQPIDAPLLLLLTVRYVLNQDFDLKKASENLERKWVIKNPSRHRSSADTFNVHTMTLELWTLSKDLRTTIDNARNITAENSKIYEYISNEWSNSSQSTRVVPSVLQRLPELIENAGRVLNDDAIS